MANVIMDQTKIIGDIEKMIAGKSNPVIDLDKTDKMSLNLKTIIESHYKSKVEIKEDNQAYHIYFV
jgi:hypothetical protein